MVLHLPSGRSNTDEEDHSIYVRNLPLDANSRQLVKRLKKFSPIKSVGIHTDFYNMSECCFADVEFESVTSKQNAIEASPITIGGCLSMIEEKRGTSLTQGDSLKGQALVGINSRTMARILNPRLLPVERIVVIGHAAQRGTGNNWT